MVLGTGAQEKAYVSVQDTTRASSLLFEKAHGGFLAANVSSGSPLKVSKIAEIVLDELKLRDTEIEYTESNRGWKGDITHIDMDVSVLNSMGWFPQLDVDDAVRDNVAWLVDTYGPVSEPG